MLPSSHARVAQSLTANTTHSLMPLSNRLIFATLCLILAHISATMAYSCTELDVQRKCPVFNNVGIGGSNYPSPTMIRMTPVINALGETSVSFETPFCRNCGFVFSFYPISWDEGMTTLVKDGQFTSLNENIMNAGTWSDWWNTGDSNCDASAAGKLMNSASNMMDVAVVDACTQTRTMKFSSFSQKRDLVLPNGKNAYALTISPIYATLTTQIFAQAMFPYSLSTSAEKYATRRSIYTFSTKYMLHAEVFADAKVISQREIVVKTTASSPRVLQVDLQLKTQVGNYWVENSCKVVSSLFGMQVMNMQVTDQTAIIKMLASVEMERYTGEIRLQCSTQRCFDAGTCEPVQANDLIVRVDQDTPDEIVATSKFTPTVTQYVGPVASPFQFEGLQGASGHHWVSLGIGQEEFLAGFSSHISHLRMCSGSCFSSEYNLHLVKNGQINDQLFANRLGLKLWSNNEMRLQRPDISGVAPLGLSFLYSAVETLKHTSWNFEIGLTFTPKDGSRGTFETMKTLVVRGAAEEKQEEEAYITKSVNLLPSSSTAPPQDLSTGSNTDKLVAVLVPSIAGGACLLCMFGIVALLGMVLLVSIIRRSLGGSVKSAQHLHMRDDASVPSDSDVDLRNHAV